MATYSATRIAERFFEYVHDDMSPCAGDCGHDWNEYFNIDATPHDVDIQELTFDSVSELVDAMRRDGVVFSEGDGCTRASSMDGSVIIDYTTAERERIFWDCSAISDALLDRVIVPSVDNS